MVFNFYDFFLITRWHREVDYLSTLYVSLPFSLSLTHTHTHTHMYVCNIYYIHIHMYTYMLVLSITSPWAVAVTKKVLYTCSHLHCSVELNITYRISCKWVVSVLVHFINSPKVNVSFCVRKKLEYNCNLITKNETKLAISLSAKRK